MRSAASPQSGRVSSPGNASSESISAAVPRSKPASVRNGIACVASASRLRPISPKATTISQNAEVRTACARVSERA